ncbi:MAG: GtrA family protein [Rhodoferax sp.]
MRFLASGAFNTAVTYGVYLVLLQVLSYLVSYSIAFALGIGLAYVLNRYVVFGASGGRYGPLLVLLIYLGQFVLGLGLVSVWVQWLTGPEALAPLFSIAISLPLTFLLNRMVFRQGKTLP